MFISCSRLMKLQNFWTNISCTLKFLNFIYTKDGKRKGGSPDKHVFYRASLLSLIFNIYQALNRNISVIKTETAPLCMTKD